MRLKTVIKICISLCILCSSNITYSHSLHNYNVQNSQIPYVRGMQEITFPINKLNDHLKKVKHTLHLSKNNNHDSNKQGMLIYQKKLLLNIPNSFEKDLTLLIEPYSITDQNSQAWYGKVSGYDNSDVTVIINGKMVLANIVFAGKHFQVTTRNANNLNSSPRYLLQVKNRQESLVGDDTPSQKNLIPIYSIQKSLKTDVAKADIYCNDDGTIVDVMILYTPLAKRAAGGEENLKLHIEDGVLRTNLAFKNSRINTQIRASYIGEIDYSEGNSIFLDLRRLSDLNDGFMDEVGKLRSDHSADMVALITSKANDTETRNADGVANRINAQVDVAFQVTRFRGLRLAYTYTLAHEFGHLQGSNHNIEQSRVQDLDAFNYGYYSLQGRFRTVMSYVNECRSAGISCPVKPYFSNPEVKYNNYVTGRSINARPGAHNAEVINYTRSSIANYYCSSKNEEYGQAPVRDFIEDQGLVKGWRTFRLSGFTGRYYGFHFRPEVDGIISHFGLRFNSPQEITLWDKQKNKAIAKATVNGLSNSFVEAKWNYSPVTTIDGKTIEVKAGNEYILTIEYSDESLFALFANANSPEEIWPLKAGDITILGGAKGYATNGFPSLDLEANSVFVGQIDILFKQTEQSKCDFFIIPTNNDKSVTICL